MLTPGIMRTYYAYLHILGLLYLGGGDGSDLHNRFTFIAETLNFTQAEQTCRDLGFDGLAVVSSPEEFTYVLEASAELRQNCGLWLGMRLNSALMAPVWDDGTIPAPDMPWVNSLLTPNLNKPCVRLHITGVLGMKGCGLLRYAVCGNYTKVFLEAVGSTHKAERPAGVTTSLVEVKKNSYFQCIALCGRYYLCRAAQFDLVSKTCRIIGPDSFTGLASSADYVTFVRRAYEN